MDSIRDYIRTLCGFEPVLEFRANRSGKGHIEESDLYFEEFVNFMDGLGKFKGTQNDFTRGEFLSDEFDYFVSDNLGNLEHKYMYGKDNRSCLYAIVSGEPGDLSRLGALIPVVYLDFSLFSDEHELVMTFIWLYDKGGNFRYAVDMKNPHDPEEVLEYLKNIL